MGAHTALWGNAALWGLTPPLHPAKAQGALPQLIRKKGGFAAGLTFASLSDSTGSSPIARKVYRKDAKGSAAHSVRDRLTALLAKRMRCLEGCRELRETHDRTPARWPTAPWMFARAFAKRNKYCQCVFRERGRIRSFFYTLSPPFRKVLRGEPSSRGTRLIACLNRGERLRGRQKH